MTARKKTSKATGRKSTAKRASTKKASTRPKAAPAAKARKGEVGVEPVTLGHIFALRPKVNTSFPQAEFLEAKRELAGKCYGSIEEAARAVAEKALTGANRKPSKHSIKRH